MSEFRDLENKAESYAKEHPQQVDKGLEEAGKAVDKETGGKYDREIQGAVGAAEKHFGDQQGQQNHGQQGDGQQGDGQQNQSG
ncbi:MAG: antitoxin [Micromonosporaceae bacterium]